MSELLQPSDDEAIVNRLRTELAKLEPTRRRRIIEKFVLAALGSIPWIGGFADRFASGLKRCKVVHIGPGIHYLQEDNPVAIGSALYEWLTELGVAAGV